SPAERLMAGQAEPSEVFDLRQRTLRARTRFLQSDVRGFLGGRIALIPHQFYILHEVSNRQLPRVLLADEVGLGKTIEACLILQRLLLTGRASRALILVPETLVHQWFVELLRRFQLAFDLFDEERCEAIEEADPDANPFLERQWILAPLPFLASHPRRAAQAREAGWDLVIVDEAHHLQGGADDPDSTYGLVRTLADQTPGLLLLTATPRQLGPEGHFARLQLLDPVRHSNASRFQEENQHH